MNSAFNFEFFKLLTPKIAQICDTVLIKMEKENGGVDKNVQITYDVHSYSSCLAEDAMIDCFFGTKLEKEKIDGLSISVFINKLSSDVFSLVGDAVYLLFGVRFIKAGLREKDKDILRRIKIIRSWGRKMVEEKIQKIE